MGKMQILGGGIFKKLSTIIGHNTFIRRYLQAIENYNKQKC